MSLIGPRPLVRSGYDLSSYMKHRLSKIKPGLSGISSIMLRNEENILSKKVNNPIEFHSTVLSSFKATLEVWYDERKSLLMYFVIFVTVWKIFFKESKFSFS